MSADSPPTLLKLAVQSLLRDEDVAVGAVEDLPGELFPSVFMEAFTRGHSEVLKAMVLSWPFPYLPLGALMSMRNLQTSDTEVDVVRVQKRMLGAVLDGLDVLLSPKTCSRRLKLQVLNMLDAHQKFWRVWAAHASEGCSSEAMKRRNTEKSEATAAEKRPLRVIVDLSLGQTFQTPFQSFLLKWIQKRKDLVQLDCTKLCVTMPCIANITEVLGMLNYGSVKEVNVRNLWTPFTLVHFAPYLGRMKNLQKLILNNIRVPVSLSLAERKEVVTQVTFEFLQLLSLGEMYMESVSFLEGHLDQVLRCLPSPLETFSLIYYQLSHSDWNQLPQRPSLRHLKYLELYGIRLTHLSPEPLRCLLNNLAATLTTLHLQACGITDAQVHAFLPALSRCAQLTTFSYMRHCTSVATLESLLGHTARLSSLSLEMYSAPEEVCVSRHGVRRLRQDQILDGLRRIMLPLNHPRTVWFCVAHYGLHCNWDVYYLHPIPCHDCIPI